MYVHVFILCLYIHTCVHLGYSYIHGMYCFCFTTVGLVFPEDAGGGYSDDEGGGFECLPTPMGEKTAASQKVWWTYFRRVLPSFNLFPPMMGKESGGYNFPLQKAFQLSTALQGPRLATSYF